MKDVGVEYNSYHACINNCILYREEEYDAKNECRKCRESRYSEKGEKNPNKIICIIPILPKLM